MADEFHVISSVITCASPVALMSVLRYSTMVPVLQN